MEIRWFDLRFVGASSHLEAPFLRDYARSSIAQVRVLLLLGVVLMGAFGILDALLLPEEKSLIWLVRFGAVIPVGLLVWLATWREWYLEWMQPLTTIPVLAAGVGITFMTVVAPPPINYSYYAGNILVIIYGYTLLRLRFVWASLAGWVLVAIYQVAAIGLTATPGEVLLNNNFFFVSANVLGMLACYAIEHSARRDYFLVHALSVEQARVRSALDDLEDRVVERTQELRGANEGLRKEVEQREAAESERASLEVQLAQAQRMEAIGNLAAGVAHDLNNILSGVVGWPELVLLDLEPGSELEKPIRTIKSAGESAAAVVQDLLTLARRGAQIREPLDVTQVVRSEIEAPALQRYAKSLPHVRLVTSIPPKVLPVIGSPVHLGKAVSNLARNAFEALLVDGTVSVSVENRMLEESMDGFETVPPGEYVVVRVADTGIGISDEDLPQIFEPFYTKKRMGRGGTGLGMTVVWSSVKDHDGYLDVQTKEGEGTAFSVFLPVSKEEVSDELRRFTIEDYRGTERLLVVDDLESQRDVAATMLGKLGYRIDTRPSGEEAVAWLADNDVDLVILDMVMDPGMDGCETYRRISEVKPGQRAIIASGFAENERVTEARRLGVGGYVKKPYTMAQLVTAVRSELDREE